MAFKDLNQLNLPRFPAFNLQAEGTVDPVFILSDALLLSLSVVSCFSFMLSIIYLFLVLGMPIMWVSRRRAFLFLKT